MDNQLKAQIFEAHHVLDKKTAEIALDFNVSEDIVDLVIEVGNMGIEYDKKHYDAVSEIKQQTEEIKRYKRQISNLDENTDYYQKEILSKDKEIFLLNEVIVSFSKEIFVLQNLLKNQTKTHIPHPPLYRNQQKSDF